MVALRALMAVLALGVAAVPGHAAPPACSAVMADAETPGSCFPPQLHRHLGAKISVEVPPAYELFHIVMALTFEGMANRDLNWSDKPYVTAVITHFARWHDDRAVKAMQVLLSKDLVNRMEFRINASAYLLTSAGRLHKLPQYTQILGQRDDFAPLVAELERFAKKSDFVGFYRSAIAQDTYRAARRLYESEADLMGMTAWLRREFPDLRPYEHVRVIVSPLVKGGQYQDVVDDKGFRELVLYASYRPEPLDAADPAASLGTAYFEFTQLNHGFISQMSNRHVAKIEAALGPRLAEFYDNQAESKYATPMLLFREYLKWGLIPLYACDRLGTATCAAFEERTLYAMQVRGEFPRYREFQPFLVNIYRNRPAGSTLADLFPQIIGWFGTPPAGR